MYRDQGRVEGTREAGLAQATDLGAFFPPRAMSMNLRPYFPPPATPHSNHAPATTLTYLVVIQAARKPVDEEFLGLALLHRRQQQLHCYFHRYNLALFDVCAKVGV